MNWYLIGFVAMVALEHVVVYIVRDAITFDQVKADAAIKALFAKKP